MTAQKQKTQSKSTDKGHGTRLTNRTGVMVLMAFALIFVMFFLFRYYVLLPHQELAKFERVETAINQAATKSSVEFSTKGVIKYCKRSGVKYGSGSPFCGMRVEFLPHDGGGTASAHGLVEYLDNSFRGLRPATYMSEQSAQYTFEGLSCRLALIRDKNGPYVLDCNGPVTRYIY